MARRKVIINGTLGAIAHPTEIDFDPVRGLVMRQPTSSAGNNLAGLAGIYLQQGVAFSWRPSNHISTIVATYSGGQLGMPDNAAINWQLLGNEGQESIFKNPFVMQAMETYPDLADDIKLWRTAWDQGDIDGANNIVATVTTSRPTELSSLNAIIQMLKNGETHFNLGQYVLKRTFSISNFFQGTIPGDENTEKVLNSVDGVPAVLATKIASIPEPAHSDPYVWGWRQLPSQMVTAATNRIEVSTEWWLALWNKNLYAQA